MSLRPSLSTLPARCLASILLLAGACSSAEEDTSSVAIGVLIDHSGATARPTWRDAAQAALEHANAGLKGLGTWKGVRFRLVFADSANAPYLAVDRARELVERDHVMGLLVDASDVALAITATHYDQNPDNDVDAPVICMACTSSLLNNPTASHPSPVLQGALRDSEQWLYRTAAHSGPEAVALLRAARALGPDGDVNGDGVWKVAVYVGDSDLGNSTFRALQDARDRHFPLERDPVAHTEQPGGLHLEVVKHPSDASLTAYDWPADLLRLTDGENRSPGVNPGLVADGEALPAVERDGFPDAIIDATLPLFAASVMRAYAGAGPSIPFLHNDNWRRESTLIELQPDELEGQQGVSHMMIDNCETSGGTFATAMVARTGHTPGLWDSQTYDATMMVILASLESLRFSGDASSVNPASLTGKQVRAALETVHLDFGRGQKVYAGTQGMAQAALAIAEGRSINYEGASGPVDFDDGGNVRNNFVQFRVKQQRFVDETTYDCVGDPVGCAAARFVCRW